jgi:hypothetical protein
MTKLKSADQIDMTFTALDYYQLVPRATGARFPSEGLNREEVKTWLSNTCFLMAVASQQDYAVVGPAFPGMSTDPLFFASIDWLLKTLVTIQQLNLSGHYAAFHSRLSCMICSRTCI